MEKRKTSQREALEAWRLKKGLARKENCHPLCSRKRSLSKVVSSPSYKPQKVNKETVKTKLNVKQIKTDKIKPQPKTDLKKNVNIQKNRSKRRQTFAIGDWKTVETKNNETPWNDKNLSLKERLDLWRDCRRKKPLQRLPVWQDQIQKSKPFSKLKYVSSATPMSQSKHSLKTPQRKQNTQNERIELNSSFKISTVDTKPEDGDATKYGSSKFAITPGRRVHFAALYSPSSPSSHSTKTNKVKYCILDSKLNKRVRFQGDKIMTPVRRSIRLSTSAIPDFLRDGDNRIVQSPYSLEEEIVGGDIIFRPNQHLNTPLNNGWLIKNTEDDDEEVNVSFT